MPVTLGIWGRWQGSSQISSGPGPGHWTCMESITHIRDLHMGASSPIFSSKDWQPMVWLPEGLVPVGSPCCPSLPCLFPKNSGTGLGTLRRLSSTPSSHSLGLVSVPTTGGCTSHSYTAPLGSSASPKRRINSNSGTPVTDPSVNRPWGISGRFHGLLCLCRTGESPPRPTGHSHTLSTQTPAQQGQGGSLTSGRHRTLQYFTPFRSLRRRT